MAKMEYMALTQLRQSPGWQVLVALWAMQHKKIVDGMRKAGKTGRDSNWRWFAGQQEGFEIAITQLDRALGEMEAEVIEVDASQEAKTQVEELLKKIKGDKP